MVEHEALGGRHDPWRLAGIGARVARDQPELGLAAGLGGQALGGALLAEQEGQRVKGDRVLQEHRPVGGDREVVQEGEAAEAIGALAQQLAGLHAADGVVGHGEFHQPNRAARAALHPEGHHALLAVVARIEAGMGAEGFAGLEHAIQQGDAFGVEGAWVEGVGGTGLPQGQQLIAELHHMGVGDVLEPHIEGVGEQAAGLLGAEHAAIERFAGLLLGQPALGTHEAVGEVQPASFEAQGGDHAVAIKRVVHPVAATLQPTGTVAVEGAVEISRDGAFAGLQRNVAQFLAHVAEAAGPVGAVVAGGGFGSLRGCCR